ncbi:Hypothetical protein DHA2_152672 [Giardia duodenalis]|uniref:Ankyrin repeat protein n=1 Tax=Giardia intestinalis TaxID=5741 RepID=V6TG17_GIAIN|nr:Hypothetical protein DHA2_152672 [Giardia intestinalis]
MRDMEAVNRFIPIQKGKTVKYFDISGWNGYEETALMLAVVHGHTEVVTLLIKHEGGMKN